MARGGVLSAAGAVSGSGELLIRTNATFSAGKGLSVATVMFGSAGHATLIHTTANFQVASDGQGGIDVSLKPAATTQADLTPHDLALAVAAFDGVGSVCRRPRRTPAAEPRDSQRDPRDRPAP